MQAASATKAGRASVLASPGSGSPDALSYLGSRGRSPSRGNNFGARNLAGVAGHARRFKNTQITKKDISV
jgi:hypothetical protein